MRISVQLSDLMQTPFHGNLQRDYPLFQQLEGIIRDGAEPMNTRLRALAKFNSGMRKHGGAEPMAPTADDVRKFMKERFN